MIRETQVCMLPESLCLFMTSGIHPFFALPNVFFYAFESRPAIQSNGQLPPLAQHLMRVAILMIKRIHAGSFLCVLKLKATGWQAVWSGWILSSHHGYRDIRHDGFL
jgi:uncharacterized membrane protein